MDKLIKATDDVYYTNYTMTGHIKLYKLEAIQHTGVFHCPDSVLHGKTFMRDCLIQPRRKKRTFYLNPPFAGDLLLPFNSLKALVEFYQYYDTNPIQ